MSFGSNSWARLAFTPSSGELKVDGDLFAVLGINADEIIHSVDPFSMLPDSVARGLIEGKEIVRDEVLSLVIIPGKTGYSNSVTLIAEQIVDYDLVSDMAGGVVGFAPGGTIHSWNMRMTYLFGPREKDVMGRKAGDILPDPILYDWESVISSAHLGHEVRVEFQPSGERRVEGVLSRGGPGVIGLFRDSTENYKTSKRLRALNRLNQAYLQSTGTGLLLLDSRLRVLLSNSGFTRITGYKGSLIGLQLHDILSADSYKWVHDASEHLSADERVEQSGVVSFINQEGRQLTLRHTLRAVRNETNQALNFVCLFEDETNLTFLLEDVNHLKKSLLDLARVSEVILEQNPGEDCNICEEVLRVTKSTALAQYFYDSYETMKLTGSAGSWPKGYPVRELSEFCFPAFVWDGDKPHRITSVELGKLASHFKSCTVLPIGKGLHNRGYLVLVESSLSESGSDSDSDLLTIVSSLVNLQHQIVQERSTRSTAEKHLELNAEFAETLFDGIPLPIAIIRMDGRVDHWNRAMELVCGVKAGEVDSEDINNLIDPEGSGFTLDSRVLGLDIPENSTLAEWAVRRRDGSRSAVYRWNVSIIDPTVGYYGDPAFLVSGIASDNHSSSGDAGSHICLHSETVDREILEYSNGLTGYLQKFFYNSLEQNNAILRIVGGTDPLAAFARTMLFSNETASRISHLLRLSILIRPDDCTVEYPDRFLTGLHRMFAERELPPPSLSLGDKLPGVMINPEVLLHCFAMLCQLVKPDSVVSFSAINADSDSSQEKKCSVHLILTGLDESFQVLAPEEILQRLGSGTFDSEAEASVILRILHSAGCSLISQNQAKLTFLLSPSD